MTFTALALVSLAGLLGVGAALPARWGLPVVVGELALGVAFGSTGTRWLHAADPTLTFLADVGFALVMFAAGSHVPMRDRLLREGIGVGAARAVAVGVVAVALALVIAAGFHTGHAGLYAVLIASSSAASAGVTVRW